MEVKQQFHNPDIDADANANDGTSFEYKMIHVKPLLHNLDRALDTELFVKREHVPLSRTVIAYISTVRLCNTLNKDA